VLKNHLGTLKDAKGYDVVISAVGGQPDHTELPTTPGCIPVYTSRQVLSGEVIPGKNVVVIGGSYIGCFTAQYLARRGAMDGDNLFFSLTNNSDTLEHILSRLNHSDRQVVLLEKGKKIGLGFESGTSWPVLGDLNRLDVPFLKNTLVTAITGTGVDAVETRKDGTQEVRHFPADCVVVASGSHADDSLGQSLREAGIEVISIGNAQKLGKAIDAIRAGAQVGLTI
jgi:2,4-dienoyl-CoA reductase (NADPH2)